MIQTTKKSECIGTRAGYVVRFTCPHCNTENFLVYAIPGISAKGIRDATCEKCKTRLAVRISGENPSVSQARYTGFRPDAGSHWRRG